MNNILLWGAGNTTKYFLTLLNMRKNKILGIVDNNIQGYFLDYPVISPEEICKYFYDILIICSLSYCEILLQCHELGLANCYSYCDKELIFLNYPELFLNPDRVIESERQLKKDLENQDLLKEQLWSTVFHDTVLSYEWFNVKSLSLGRSAIGYNYAYVISRVLHSMHPKSILEFGLGQSSKILNSYFQFYKNEMKVYDLIEHDVSWKEFFSSEIQMGGVSFHLNKISIYEEYGDRFYKYDNLDEVLKGKKYNLISIDGPFGYYGKYIGRTDIVKYIPNILEDDWVILMDDYERIQEKNAIRFIEQKLKKEHISYYKGVYQGENHICILVSSNWRFLTTL